GGAHQLLQLTLRADVPAHLVLELTRPVPAAGAGRVTRGVGVRVDVHLDELDFGVVQVLSHPIGGDKYIIGCHAYPPGVHPERREGGPLVCHVRQGGRRRWTERGLVSPPALVNAGLRVASCLVEQVAVAGRRYLNLLRAYRLSLR